MALRKVSIMEELAERRQGLVGGEGHGPPTEVAVVDDAIEHVSGVRGIALVADLVDADSDGNDRRDPATV